MKISVVCFPSSPCGSAIYSFPGVAAARAWGQPFLAPSFPPFGAAVSLFFARLLLFRPFPFRLPLRSSLLLFFLLFLDPGGGTLQAQGQASGPCQDYFPSDAAVLSYCKNNAACTVQLVQGNLLQIACDCTALHTTEYFFAGPDCSIKQKITYLKGTEGEVKNTCWLENLLALNSWKDVSSRVSSFCYKVPCPSPDGSSV